MASIYITSSSRQLQEQLRGIVAPGFTTGEDWNPAMTKEMTQVSVAPGFAAGRGLELDSAWEIIRTEGVAPGFAAGGGLEQMKRSRSKVEFEAVGGEPIDQQERSDSLKSILLKEL
jgi:hypothetical protein